MSRQGASKSKTRQARLTLRSILWLAYEQDLIARDPTSMLEGKRRRKRKSAKGEAPSAPKAWGTSDAKRFLEFVRGDEMEALWVFYLSTGVRRGEALGLEWSSVDLEAGTVTIRQQLCIVGRELRFQQPKTDSSTRTIAMGPELVAVLDAHRRTQIEMRLSSDSWDDQLALVFAGAGGRPIRPDYVTKRFKHLVHEAGLEWIRLHGLRHTMASLALQNGTDIATVSRRLGHSDTNITARIYLHGSEESDRHAATALDELLIGY